MRATLPALAAAATEGSQEVCPGVTVVVTLAQATAATETGPSSERQQAQRGQGEPGVGAEQPWAGRLSRQSGSRVAAAERA